MRTLLHVFATFAKGGPQTRFAAVANHFGRAYRHRIIAMDGLTDAMRLLAPDVEAELVSVPVERGNSWRNLKSFAEVLGRIRPDLLISSNWGSIEWAIANRLKRIPHLHLEDGFGPEEAGRQFSRRVWMRRLVLRGSLVVVPSRRLYDIARDVWRVPKARLLHIPNGVDCNRFARPPDPAFAARLGITAAGDVPVIGTVARLSPEKNVGRLIDAFAGVLRERPAMLAIVGDGPEREALNARATRLGIEKSVVFTGMCPDPERLLPSFAVFAMSSDTEQMPLSVLEAMAAARPVAATDVGDIRDMLAKENGRFVVKKDPAMLQAALLDLLSDQERAVAIGAANAARARAMFDENIMFGQYQMLFEGKWPVSPEVAHGGSANVLSFTFPDKAI